nr:type VI secretion system tip protein TssI/VgrG [Burkholderia stabilis]
MPRYTLDLITQNPSIDLKDVLNQAVTVNIALQDGSERQIHGYLVRFGFERNDGGIAHYRGELVPWLWYLGKRVNSRIYQQVTVLDVLRKVFADYGALVDYQTHIKQEPKPEDYVVQFQESDLNFVSRLLERHGLFYYFEYRQDGHTLVIADDSASCPDQAHDPVVTYNAASGVQQADRLTALSASRETQPGVVALHTFDYKHPKSRPYVELPTLADQGNAPKLEVYDGSSAFAYKDTSDGEAEAKRRLEVFEWQAKVFRGESGCRGLTVGRKFKIDGHFWFDPAKQDDNQFLVVGLEIDAKNNFDDASAQPGSFRNTLTLIRSKIPYRPVRRHDKPVMPGPQSAIVVGPKGQEIHTDGMGRIKVHFPWDRYGKNDQESSCWIRVSQPWAGRGWGTVAIPRVNQEVIVDFLNGDPDRPIIVGRMFNAEQTPPYALPDGAHQMGFHSNSTPGGGGFCEVVIHDKKGEELVNIHSQKDMATTVQNNHVTVVNGPNQTNVVTQGQHASIVRKAISVQSQDEHIQHTAKTAVILHAQEQHMALKAKGPVQIESDTQHVHVKGSQSIVLECGKAKITLSANGEIVLDGTRVVVLGSQSVDLNPDGATGPASPPLVPVTDPAAPAQDLAAPAAGGGGGGGGRGRGGSGRPGAREKARERRAEEGRGDRAGRWRRPARREVADARTRHRETAEGRLAYPVRAGQSGLLHEQERPAADDRDRRQRTGESAGRRPGARARNRARAVSGHAGLFDQDELRQQRTGGRRRSDHEQHQGAARDRRARRPRHPDRRQSRECTGLQCRVQPVRAERRRERGAGRHRPCVRHGGIRVGAGQWTVCQLSNVLRKLV